MNLVKLFILILTIIIIVFLFKYDSQANVNVTYLKDNNSIQPDDSNTIWNEILYVSSEQEQIDKKILLQTIINI